jgi:hypothetical protein
MKIKKHLTRTIDLYEVDDTYIGIVNDGTIFWPRAGTDYFTLFYNEKFYAFPKDEILSANFPEQMIGYICEKIKIKREEAKSVITFVRKHYLEGAEKILKDGFIEDFY